MEITDILGRKVAVGDRIALACSGRGHDAHLRLGTIKVVDGPYLRIRTESGRPTHRVLDRDGKCGSILKVEP